MFLAIALNLENEAFIVHITFISQDSNIYPFRRGQIALLKADKAPTFLVPKYTDFVDLFSKNLATKLLEYVGINDYAINLIKDSQPL